MGLGADAVAPMAPHLLVVSGDSGAAAERVRKALAMIAEAASARLPGYEPLMWSDLAAERGAEITAAMHDFLRRSDLPPTRIAEREGEVSGISYRVRGAGPPLLSYQDDVVHRTEPFTTPQIDAINP